MMGVSISVHQKTISSGAEPKPWVIGKVGEWVQGVDRAGEPTVYSLVVTSSPFQTMTSIEPAERLAVVINPDQPADCHKAQMAVRELAVRHGFGGHCNYRLTIRGSPPRGKGLGSSSIDIASVLLAIKDERGLAISKAELFGLMCRVERSDYLFEPEAIVAANPVEGSYSVLARAPKCLVLAWDTDPAGSVNTQAVRHLDIARQPFSQEYRDLSGMVQTGSTETLLRAATRSAELNNLILPKIGFAGAHQLVKQLQNVGLIAAHTGTYLGFVLPEPVDTDLRAYLLRFLTDRLSATPVTFKVGEPSRLARF